MNPRLQMLMRQLQQKQRQQSPSPMAYNPGATRQFTPSPAPDVPFMPAPQVGPQSIDTGFGPMGGLMLGGLGGLGGMMGPGGIVPPYLHGGGNPGPGTPGGPMVQPPAPQTNAGPQINPQLLGIGASLMQQSRRNPMQMIPMQMLRGGR